MRIAGAIILLLSSLALAQAPRGVGTRDAVVSENTSIDAVSIVVTINPEARISVARGRKALSMPACGEATVLPVKIVNQGFVTAPLVASILDPLDESVLEFSDAPLNGLREEHRVLKLILKKPGPVVVTLSFRARNEIPNLSGANQLDLLLQCRWASAS